MKPIIKIIRYWQDENQTMGTCVVLGDNDLPLFSGITLERGWKNNETNISCIPKGGLYEVELEYSPKFKKDLWEIKGVKGRSECKFHAANYWKQLNGCIALGTRPQDIDKDGYIDITASGETMVDFHKALQGHKKALLLIEGKPTIR